jgi:hypothetical protein
LEAWGLDLVGFDANAEDFGEDFSLPMEIKHHFNK